MERAASLSLGIGSGQIYTQAELRRILQMPIAGDASVNLAAQLIAAKLNLENGSDPDPVSGTIAHAELLLSSFTGKLSYGVPASSDVGKNMLRDASILDRYNNGLLTPLCNSE